MTPIEKMIFRLYAIPFLLLLGSLFADYFLGDWLPSRFAGVMIISQLSEKASSFAPWASGGLLVLSLAWAAHSSWRLWKWQQGGNGEPCCHVCGGLMDLHDGRYGLYYRCLACGNTRKA
jgi:hypothetical protein